MLQSKKSNLLIAPGQGSFFEGMYSLTAKVPELRESYELGDEISLELFGGEQINGKSLSEHAKYTKKEEIAANTVIAQPLVVTTAVGLIKYLKKNENFTTAYGHSLGELVALFAAGSISEADAIRLAMMRGVFSHQAGEQKPAAMAALLNLPHEIREKFKFGDGEESDEVLIAAENHPDEITVVGSKEKIEEAVANLRDTYQRVKGITKEQRRSLPNGVMLKISGGFHSWMMKPAQSDFKAELEKSDIKVPAEMLFFSNHSHNYEASPSIIKQHLVDQLIHPVKFWYDIGKLVADGHVRIVESGPGDILIRGLKDQQLKQKLPPDLQLVSAHRQLGAQDTKNPLQTA
jgi:[acyl-carrier-protein] S-malonyltransferase